MISKTLDEILEVFSRLTPQAPEDIKKNMRAALIGVFERLDLVTREELEVQEAVLKRTRARLEEMEKRVAELEAKLK